MGEISAHRGCQERRGGRGRLHISGHVNWPFPFGWLAWAERKEGTDSPMLQILLEIIIHCST